VDEIGWLDASQYGRAGLARWFRRRHVSLLFEMATRPWFPAPSRRPIEIKTSSRGRHRVTY